jgi:hypothetical protein
MAVRNENMFIVTIVTSENISDENQIDEMADNIARAISNEVNSGMGICPEDSETHTKTIYVKAWYSEKQVIKHP